MVNDAAKVLAEQGEAAFEEFRRPGSRWLREDGFLLVLDADGTCVFHPRLPAHVGTNLVGVTDVLGKPAHRWLMETAANRDRPYGWVHYLSPPPQSLFPLWTSSYVVGVRCPRGKLYALSSGLYNMPMEKQFIVDLVNRAADLIESRDPQAFSTLRDEANNYNLLGTYVYVFSPTGQLKVDPAYPPEVERDASDYRDAVGHYFVRDALKRLENRETAWVTYMWPKPGETTPSKKLMYARRVELDDEVYLVGSDLFSSPPIWMRH